MRWTLFAAVAAAGYFFFSDGDVGYLLTLSAMARSFALMTVAYGAARRGVAKGSQQEGLVY